MSQPPGFRDQSSPHFVCCLKKAIYGLKEAPRAWYTALKQALLEFGFVNTKSDSSLLVYTIASITAYFLVYVDDLIITSNNSHFAASVIQQLGRKFSLKDLGPLHFFLGIEVIPTQNGYSSLSINTSGIFLPELAWMEQKMSPLHCQLRSL